jgi:hypothetical protein
MRAFDQLSKNKQLLEELVHKSGDTAVIGRDLERYMLSPAGKIERAFEQVKNKIAEAATPERIEKLTNAILKLTDALVGAVEFAELLGSSLDMEGTAAKMIAKREIEKGKDLSPAEKAKLADSLEQQVRVVRGDDPGANARRAGLRQAAAKLREEGAAGDAWVKRDRAGFDPIQFAIAKANAMGNPAALAPGAIAAAQGIASSVPGGDRVAAKMLDMLAEIARNTAKGTKVEVNGNAVVNAQRGATRHRSNPRG